MTISLTNSESQAESHVTDGVDRSVDGGVTNIDQIAQLRHHGRIDHANSKSQTGIWDNQVANASSEWDLKAIANSVQLRLLNQRHV